MTHELAIYTFSVSAWTGNRMYVIFMDKKEDWILFREGYKEECVEIPHVKTMFNMEVCFEDLRNKMIEMKDMMLIDKQGGRVIWNQFVKSNFKALDRLAKESIINKHFINGTSQIRRELV